MVLTLTMDEVPEMVARKASIIELTVSPVDQRALVKLLANLDMRERLREFAWDRDLNWITVSDGRTTLSGNERSGGIRYCLRPLESEPGTKISTSPSRLEAIARGFLDRLGRPSDRMTLDRITYLRMESGTAYGEISARATLDAGLIFTRTVDDIPVIGPGGMAMVKVGTDEAVVGGERSGGPFSGAGRKSISGLPTRLSVC